MRTHSPSQVAWSEGRRPLIGAAVRSPDEASELSQWPRPWWQHYKYRRGYYFLNTLGRYIPEGFERKNGEKKTNK